MSIPAWSPGVPSPAGPLGLHPGSAELVQKGCGPAGMEKWLGVLVGGTGPFSPSPVRPLDGRVGLDPKGLGKHVCWSGLGKRRRAQTPGAVRNATTRHRPDPQPWGQPCWGPAGKEARLETRAAQLRGFGRCRDRGRPY